MSLSEVTATSRTRPAGQPDGAPGSGRNPAHRGARTAGRPPPGPSLTTPWRLNTQWGSLLSASGSPLSPSDLHLERPAHVRCGRPAVCAGAGTAPPPMWHRPGQALALLAHCGTPSPAPSGPHPLPENGSLSCLPPLGQVGLGPPQNTLPSHTWGGLEERRSPRPREPGNRAARGVGTGRRGSGRRSRLRGAGGGGTHTTVHATQGNRNQTVYFTVWGAPPHHKSLSVGRITSPGATVGS